MSAAKVCRVVSMFFSAREVSSRSLFCSFSVHVWQKLRSTLFLVQRVTVPDSLSRPSNEG